MTAVPASNIVPRRSSDESRRTRAGFRTALGAYLAWGFVPAYFKLLTHVPPMMVLAHRIVWSVLFLASLLTIQRQWHEVRDALRRRRTLLVLICSTTLIAINWFVFIWAITHGMLLQASLGYFINPLVNVLLGVVILRERLRPGQLVGLVLAIVGVLIPTVSTGGSAMGGADSRILLRVLRPAAENRPGRTPGGSVDRNRHSFPTRHPGRERMDRDSA